MRIFQTHFFNEIIVLTDCTEEDIYDTNGAYTFTLVVGKDEDGNDQKIPKDIEVTFNELNL